MGSVNSHDKRRLPLRRSELSFSVGATKRNPAGRRAAASILIAMEHDDDATERRNFLIERIVVWTVYSTALLVTIGTLLLPLYIAYQIGRHGWH